MPHHRVSPSNSDHEDFGAEIDDVPSSSDDKAQYEIPTLQTDAPRDELQKVCANLSIQGNNTESFFV